MIPQPSLVGGSACNIEPRFGSMQFTIIIIEFVLNKELMILISVFVLTQELQGSVSQCLDFFLAGWGGGMVWKKIKLPGN